jgi:23S rRNA pseudouridine1911/1915/1917 synthase
MPEYSFTVSADNAHTRLDLCIMEYVQKQGLAISRSHLKKIILDGCVAVNGRAILKPHYRIQQGQGIVISVVEKTRDTVDAEDIPLDVVYEDEDLAVINKPTGLVVHPAPGNPSHTLSNAILYRFGSVSDINPGRPGIVHRLDKDTSGLLVIAKNNSSHLKLAEQFSRHSIKRRYVALVRGRVEFDEHVIEMPIGRHPFKRKNMAVGFGEHTKYAKTSYKTVQRSDTVSLLQLEPYTGRTHQLRVHLAFAGHPILGDTKYAKHNVFVRLALHAVTLGFVHPRSGKYMEFSSPVPPEFTLPFSDAC